MAESELPSFDLIVATVDRTEELRGLFGSLERQTYSKFRVLLVDQNEDDRVDSVRRAHGSLDVVRLRAPRGLSRARNAALGEARAEVIAFPDDDCVYPDDLLERVARRLASNSSLDGLTGRTGDPQGCSSPSWARDPSVLSRKNLWNRVNSGTIFLRASAAVRVGEFDEQLGLGSGSPWSSGEEIDYLIRALDAGARVEYDPSLLVQHEIDISSPGALHAVAKRDGASIGYILRKHRYSRRSVARLLLRPAGGVVLALARRDSARAGLHLSTLRGRLLGYRRAATAS